MIKAICTYKSSKLVTYLIAILLIVSVLFSIQTKHVNAEYLKSQNKVVTQVNGVLPSGTWTSGNVYIVTGNSSIEATSPITIEGGAIVKFNPNVTLTVNGGLTLNGSAGNEVKFTSINDDDPEFGGDTNGNGGNTTPAPGDWGSIIFPNDGSVMQYAIIRYSTNGIQIKNSGNSDISAQITNNIFGNNTNGLYLDINSSADINATISHNSFTSNTYGVTTYQEPSKTGTTFLNLSDNHFTANTGLPIYLGGSALPSFDGETNTFTGYTTPVHGNPEQRLGIGLGGNFSYSMTLPIVHNLSPDLILPYVVVADTTISAGSTVDLSANTVIKFDLGKQLIVKGTLSNSGGTVGNPTIFTSIRDDSQRVV